ncbi:MAG TPA: EAL domain-containing protein [Chloroflexota bacterium]|nr:EAL domain-containing protein [Chloroflexota bacterium]
MNGEPRLLHLLLVEDSDDDAELLLIELRRAGYELHHTRVETAEQMHEALRDNSWDVVISDYHLPRFDALAALDTLHEQPLDVPFIIISGAIGEETAVAAMKRGAHDYVMKGNLARLVPAIERELREARERSARREAELALALSEDRYRTIVDTANDAILAFDERGRVTYANGRAPELLGYPQAELLEMYFRDILQARDRELWDAQAANLQAGDRLLLDVGLVRKDGAVLWALNSCSPTFDRKGTYVGAIAMLKDVTERKQAEEVLAYQALHDPLSGLPNRNLLHDRLDRAILARRRDATTLALLLIDLDRFKEVNDTYGHDFGDELLKQVGPRLTAALRESDTVARLGGDEFAVILPNCGDVEAATSIATKLLRALEEPFLLGGEPIYISGSLGVVMCPDHGDDGQTLMRRADVAMYAAKRDGSGISLYADEQDQTTATQLALTNQLRHAIEHGELEMHYQPKVDLATGRLVDVEALVRWRHKERGLVGPDNFIPLAERTGLIKPMTHWVVSQSLRDCRAWHEAGLHVGVAINLSVRNLQDPTLPGLMDELLREHQVDPAWLHIEITETVLMTNAARTIEIVQQLSDMGIYLSIDDFGTGYSSLSYLKRLPVRELKIDKSFVRDMAHDDNDAAIVRSTIDLGHNLGLEVVAEGVEDLDAWNRLLELGCDLAQGYFMAAPMPAHRLEPWLAESGYAAPQRPLAVASA